MAWAKRGKIANAGRRYGYAHKQERARRVAASTPATPCSRCGRPLGSDTREWHLPHDETGTAYLPGLWHGACNRAEGSVRGSRIGIARQKRARFERDEW